MVGVENTGRLRNTGGPAVLLRFDVRNEFDHILSKLTVDCTTAHLRLLERRALAVLRSAGRTFMGLVAGGHQNTGVGEGIALGPVVCEEGAVLVVTAQLSAEIKGWDGGHNVNNVVLHLTGLVLDSADFAGKV